MDDVFNFDAIVSGATFKLVRETGWNSYYDGETMGGDYALCADVTVEGKDYSVFVKENGYEISDQEMNIQLFDMNGKFIQYIA